MSIDSTHIPSTRSATGARESLLSRDRPRAQRTDDHAQFNRPPVEIERRGSTDADLMKNIERINAVIEPIVKKHLDQGYYLLDLDLDV